MLKGIPPILSPELMKALLEMGHGDELLICDGNYPRMGQPDRVVRCDGHGIPELLDAILRFMPLDTFVENPAVFMEVVPGDPYVPEIWDAFREIGRRHEPEGLRETTVERQAFYARGAKTYAAVATSEGALYANIILKKGVVKHDKSV